MVSSEKVQSGKFPGGRSSFSQTCNLLSQYLKEKGTFGDLTLNLTPSFPQTPKGTANLLPKIEQQDQNPKPEIGDMTIFYGGKVIVLSDIPADKAEEIMTLAATATAESAAGTRRAPQLPPLGSADLPIARKNSLARFLEKRKDRIAGSAPYQVSKAVVKAEPWLETGPQLPLQTHHY